MAQGILLYRGIALLVGAALSLTACDPAYPALSGRVVDQAEVLSPATEGQLSQLSEGLETRTGRQFVVVTVKSLGGRPIETYARSLGNHWGLGRAGRNDGILLMVAPAEHTVRIEVGKGLEPVLTDTRATSILNTEVLPRFSAGALEPGVLAGAQAIVQTLDPSAETTPP